MRKEQVLAGALGHPGGRDPGADAEGLPIHPLSACAPTGRTARLLDRAQRLDLHRQRRFADLVEEQVPPFAAWNNPLLSAVAPVKLPLR